MSHKLGLDNSEQDDSGIEEIDNESSKVTYFEETTVELIKEDDAENEAETSDEKEETDYEDEDKSAGGRYFGGGGGGGKCFNCGQPGHIIKDCPEATVIARISGINNGL